MSEHGRRPELLAQPLRAFLLGTPYCGSTVFGQALGAHSEATYLGEMDRLVRYPEEFWAGKGHPSCNWCTAQGRACPIWTEERVRTVKELPHAELFGHFAAEFGPSVLVDGSKNLHWLEKLLADDPRSSERTVAFITVRSPFAFAHSFALAHRVPVSDAAERWRRVYAAALGMVASAHLPVLPVRYEEFALRPEQVLRPACALLGLDYEPGMLHFQSRPRHDMGGNFRALVQGERTEHYVAAASGRIDRGALERTERPFGGWLSRSWQTGLSADDVAAVMGTPGLVDVATVLGYELGNEVAEWAGTHPAPLVHALVPPPPGGVRRAVRRVRRIGGAAKRRLARR